VPAEPLFCRLACQKYSLHESQRRHTPSKDKQRKLAAQSRLRSIAHAHRQGIDLSCVSVCVCVGLSFSFACCALRRHRSERIVVGRMGSNSPFCLPFCLLCLWRCLRCVRDGKLVASVQTSFVRSIYGASHPLPLFSGQRKTTVTCSFGLILTW